MPEIRPCLARNLLRLPHNRHQRMGRLHMRGAIREGRMMPSDNSRLRPLISDLNTLLAVATEAMNSIPTKDELNRLSDKYTSHDDEWWSLRWQAALVGDLYDRLDRAIIETQDSLDDLLAVGKRMKKGGRK